jgi:hypothetical protein
MPSPTDSSPQSRIRIGQNRLQRQASMAARIDLRIVHPIGRDEQQRRIIARRDRIDRALGGAQFDLDRSAQFARRAAQASAARTPETPASPSTMAKILVIRPLPSPLWRLL